MMSNTKPYLIDGIPADAREIIRMAAELDEQFSGDRLKRTSKAAAILRDHGHDVTENWDYSEVLP